MTCLVVASALAASACKPSVPPAGAAANSSATAMGNWSQWQNLEPLVTVARNHADEQTVTVLEQASTLLSEGKAASAGGKLVRQLRLLFD